MYHLFTDGGSRGNPGPSAIAAFIFDNESKLIDFFGKYTDIGTNNRAEYMALLNGIKLLKKNNIKDVICSLDSELVVKQLNGEYKVKDAEIKKFVDMIKLECLELKTVSFRHVPRAENHHADKLVNIILDSRNEVI